MIKQRYQFETEIETGVGDDEPSSESIESRRKPQKSTIVYAMTNWFGN